MGRSGFAAATCAVAMVAMVAMVALPVRGSENLNVGSIQPHQTLGPKVITEL